MPDATEQAKRMTLEEFFAWQQLQDENYELRDGIPVLHRKHLTAPPNARMIVEDNLARWLAKLNAEERRRIEVVVFPPDSISAVIEHCDAWKRSDRLTALVLVDTFEPSIEVRHGEEREVLSGPDAVVGLPGITRRLALAELYEGLTFPVP